MRWKASPPMKEITRKSTPTIVLRSSETVGVPPVLTLVALRKKSPSQLMAYSVRVQKS